MAIGDNEVGRVTVRVVPDYSGFRDSLEKQLNDIEKKQQGEKRKAPIEAELEGGKEVDDDLEKITKKRRKAKVEVEVDESEGELDRFQRRLINQISSIVTKVEPKIPLTVEGENLRRQIQTLEKQYIKKISTELELDVEEATRQRQEFVEKVQQMFANVKPLELVFENTFIDEQKAIKLGQKMQQFADKVAQEKAAERQKELKFMEQVAVQDRQREARKIAFLKGVQVQNQKELAVMGRIAEMDRQREALMERQKRKLEEILVVVDTKKFRDQAISQVERLGNSAIAKIPVGVAYDPLREQVYAHMERLRREFEAKINVNLELSAAEKAALAAEIATFSATLPDFNVGGGFLEDMLNKVKNFRAFGVGMVPIIAALSLLPPAIALVTGALISIPGAIAGIAAPIGAVMLGLDGIKKAAEAAEPAFKKLRENVSKAFEVALEEPFKKLIDYMPKVEGPLNGLAQKMSGMFDGVVDTVTSDKNVGRVRSIIDDIGDGFRNATPGVQGFTDGIIGLADKLAARFPEMGTAFSKLGTDFMNWVDRISKDGSLDRMLDNMRSAVAEISGFFGDTLKQGFDWMSDPSFGSDITTFLSELRSLISDTLPALATSFQSIAEALVPLAKAVDLAAKAQEQWDKVTGADKSNGLMKLFDRISLLPGANPAISNAMDIFLAGMPAAAADAGTQASEKFANSFAAGLAGSTALGAESALNAANLTQAITGQLDEIELGKQLEALKSVFQGTGVTEELKAQVSGQVESVIAQARATLEALGPELSGSLDASMLPLQDKGRQGALNIAEAFASTLTTQMPSSANRAVAAVAGAISAGLGSAVAETARMSTGMVQAMNAALAPIPEVAAAWFGTVPAGVQQGMAPAIVTAADMCGQIITTMLSYVGAAEQAGIAIGASFAAGLGSTGGMVEQAASGLMGLARLVFPNSPAKKGPFSGSGWVDRSGEAVGAAFAQGMKDSAGGVYNVAKEIMQAVKDVFGSAEGINLNFNFGGMPTEMASIASSAQDFQKSMSTAVGPATPGGGEGDLMGLTVEEAEARVDALTQQLADLEIQRKELMAQKYGGADKDIIRAQLDEIAAQKNLLGLEKDRLSYALKYGQETDKMKDAYGKLARAGIDAPINFGKAVSGQFMSDLGMSGNGAIPTLASAGINYVMQFANFDQALSGLQTIQNRNALQYTQR